MAATYLDKILESHRSAAQRDRRSFDDLLAEVAAAPRVRSFADALRSDGLSVIAEVKKRSPSKGLLREGVEAGPLAAEYERGGAACVSVLTDADYFGGCADDLSEVRSAVGVPILRKDFTVDARDVLDARIMGADAVLLIVAALDGGELREFLAIAGSVGMDALVEVHDEAELERALLAGANMVGVNQRDLFSFEVDRERAVRVREAIPDGITSVAESGVGGPQDARRLASAGFDAVLVGEYLVRSDDPASAVAALAAR